VKNIDYLKCGGVFFSVLSGNSFNCG